MNDRPPWRVFFSTSAELTAFTPIILTDDPAEEHTWSWAALANAEDAGARH